MEIVRAKEVPEIIFNRIAKKLGLRIFSVEIEGNLVMKVLFVGEFQAVVGCFQQHSKCGDLSYLVVWFYVFEEDFKIKDCDVYQDKPFFQIAGGSFPSGKDDKGHEGDSVDCIAIVPLGGQSDQGVFPLDSSFVRFVKDVFNTSVSIAIKTKCGLVGGDIGKGPFGFGAIYEEIKRAKIKKDELPADTDLPPTDPLSQEDLNVPKAMRKTVPRKKKRR